MGSKSEPETHQVPKLPLFAIQATKSPDHSGTITPPLQTSASVPFRWEEQPGKPRFSSFTNHFSQKPLELPPRLLLMGSEIPKLPSPTTVLQGPPDLGRPRFQSSSFRMIRKPYKYGSEEWFGSSSWGTKKDLKGKREVGGGGSVFPSSTVERESDGSCSERGKNTKKTKINGSSPSLSPHARPHFWATIYKGLKQAVLWSSSSKQKKESL